MSKSLSGEIELFADEHWLVIVPPDGSPPLRIDARIFDRIMVDDDVLTLSLNDYPPFQIEVPSGYACALALTNALTPFTRSAPITNANVYEYAKWRLAMSRDPPTETFRLLPDMHPPLVLLGRDRVHPTGEHVCIGRHRFRISDVAECARDGSAIELDEGSIPAMVVMMAVIASRRVENAERLAARIAEYEEGATSHRA